MNRREFIFKIINKSLKPLFYLGLLIIGVILLINSYKHELRIKKEFLFGVIVVIVILFVTNLLSFLFDTIREKTPEKTKIILQKADKILFFLLLLIIIYFIYIKWEKVNLIGLLGFIVISLFQYFKKKKQTKQT